MITLTTRLIRSFLVLSVMVGLTFVGGISGVRPARAAAVAPPTLAPHAVPVARSTAYHNPKIQLTTTTQCLSSDYRNVYTVNCDVASTWTILPLNNGYFLLQADNTGDCLSNFNYFVTYPALCNVNNSGQWWNFFNLFGTNVIRNVGVNRYLASDYSQQVYFIDYNAGETWRLI